MSVMGVRKLNTTLALYKVSGTQYCYVCRHAMQHMGGTLNIFYSLYILHHQYPISLSSKGRGGSRAKKDTKSVCMNEKYTVQISK